jgi:DNA invertase Pin-like site-specific DNA recombinase
MTGTPSSKRSRDGFADPIAAIEAGRVDMVVVRDIDRLTRT